jgi:hypothetical protein
MPVAGHEADVRQLPFQDDSFDTVIDKGTSLLVQGHSHC